MNKATLYVGLFDKDTKAQRFTSVEALKIAQTIVLSHVEGATISESHGIYKHDDGSVVVEPSLRIEISTENPDVIASRLSRDLKVALNQESVLVEISDTQTSFQ